MATASLLLVADYKNRALLSAMGSRLPASTPQFVQGDNVAVEIHLVTVSSSFTNPTPETAIPASATVYLAVGTPGSTPVAQASLSTALGGNLGRSGTLSLNTAEVESFLAGAASKPATLEIEMTEQDGTVTTLAQVACTVFNDLIEAGGVAPNAVPSIVADIADMRADLDALRGGVPLTGWANSTAYPFGTCTITGGIPTALEFAGSTDDFAYAELSLTDFAPDTLDISGTVSAGTVELTDLSLVFLDGAGAEAGTIGELTIGAAFSFASVVVPAGAVKVAVKALGTAATSSLSAGFSALSVTAHANLSVLTAEALDDILADKAQALADAGTVAALVTPAQADAQTVADLLAPAQADAAAVSGYAATAAAAVADMTVAPLDSIATSSQVVRGSDLRLGLRGCVALPKSATSSDGRLSPVSSWPLGALSVCYPDGYAADAGRDRFLGGSTSTIGDNCWLVYGLANGKVRLKAGSQNSSEVTVPAGTKWTHLVYDRTANTLSLYCNDSTTALVSITRTPTTPLDNCVAPVGGWGGQDWSYSGRVGAVVALNIAASALDRIAAMRGEYPQAWIGGVASYANTGAWTETNNPVAAGVTINTNAGGVLDVASVAAAGYYFQFVSGGANTAPLLQQGRVVRLRYSLTVASGTVRAMPFNAVSTDGYRAGPVTLAAGTDMVVDLPVDVVRSSGGGVGLKLGFDSAVFVLSNVSIEILGAQLLVGPQDWTRTRGVDISGNCNDLIYGTGVVAVEPATKARVVQATAAGATVSAGAVASVGTLTGATYRDAKALAALRQWDSVSANWRQARPANCAALQAAVTANGTPLVEATAITANAVVSANAALNLIHHIN